MTPLVSIIFPCYNCEQFVEAAMNSLLDQTYRNIEVIAIDDASTDGTFGKLVAMASGDSRIRVVRNEVNIGLILTLNKGIKLCGGEFIARMDADDMCHLNRIEKQVAFLEATPDADVVSCFCEYWNHDGTFHSLNSYFSATQNEACRFINMFDPPILHAGIVCRGDVLKEGGFVHSDENRHIEDYDLWTRLLRKGKKLAVIPEYLYYYRRNFSSVSHMFRSVQDRNHIRKSAENLQETLGLTPDPLWHRVVLNRVNDAVDRNAIRQSSRFLDNTFRQYLSERRLSDLEKAEIRYWIDHRKLKILFLQADHIGKSDIRGMVTVATYGMGMLLRPNFYRVAYLFVISFMRRRNFFR